jgi:hypothetical protein
MFGIGWIGAYDGSAAPNRWKAYTRLADNSIESGLDAYTKINGRNPGKKSDAFLIKVLPSIPDKVLPYRPKKTDLPPGWKIGRTPTDKHIRILKPSVDREGKPKWIGVPIVQGVGDIEEQKAKLEYDRWRLERLSERLSKLRVKASGYTTKVVEITR